MSRLAADPRRLGRLGLYVGGAALLGFIIVALFGPRYALQSWLAATLFWTGLSLGGLGLLMVHHLTAGRWGWYIRPILHATATTLPFVLLAFIPLLLGLDSLFPWMAPAQELSEQVQQKLLYLNAPFFILRSLLYFLIWIGLTFALRAWQRPSAGRFQGWSALGLILYGISITFYGYDWVLSLDPEFYSSAIGYVLGTAQFVSILAFAILMAAWLQPSWQPDAAPPYQDLGNLLLAAVMLWAYIAFTKYLIIWIADLPPEIRWYLDRQGAWLWLSWIMIFGHFAVPFVILLARRVKRSRRLLAATAAYLLLMHWLNVEWWILPSFQQRPLWAALLDVLAPIALGGLWLAVFLWRLQQTDWRSREVFDG